jgi:hypothetical protein
MANLAELYKKGSSKRIIKWIQQDIEKVCSKYIGQPDTDTNRVVLTHDINRLISKYKIPEENIDMELFINEEGLFSIRTNTRINS